MLICVAGSQKGISETQNMLYGGISNSCNSQWKAYQFAASANTEKGEVSRKLNEVITNTILKAGHMHAYTFIIVKHLRELVKNHVMLTPGAVLVASTDLYRKN